MPDFFVVHDGDQHDETEEEFERRKKREDPDEIRKYNEMANQDCGPGW